MPPSSTAKICDCPQCPLSTFITLLSSGDTLTPEQFVDWPTYVKLVEDHGASKRLIYPQENYEATEQSTAAKQNHGTEPESLNPLLKNLGVGKQSSSTEQKRNKASGHIAAIQHIIDAIITPTTTEQRVDGTSGYKATLQHDLEGSKATYYCLQEAWQGREVAQDRMEKAQYNEVVVWHARDIAQLDLKIAQHLVDLLRVMLAHGNETEELISSQHGPDATKRAVLNADNDGNATKPLVSPAQYCERKHVETGNGGLKLYQAQSRFPWNDDDALDDYKEEIGVQLIKMGFPRVLEHDYSVLKPFITRLDTRCMSSALNDYDETYAARADLEKELRRMGLDDSANRLSQEEILKLVPSDPYHYYARGGNRGRGTIRIVR